METNPTFCEDCDNVSADSRREHPARWTCQAFPRRPGFGFVTAGPHPRVAPFLACRDINSGGACPLWTARRLPEDTP